MQRGSCARVVWPVTCVGLVARSVGAIYFIAARTADDDMQRNARVLRDTNMISLYQDIYSAYAACACRAADAVRGHA